MIFLSDGTVISISCLVWSGQLSSWCFSCYSLVSIDWHIPHDGGVVVFIVHHSLWLMLVPFVCNLYIMIFTDALIKICCAQHLIVPGDVLCFN